MTQIQRPKRTHLYYLMGSVGEEYGIALLYPVPQGFSGGCNQVLPPLGFG